MTQDESMREAEEICRIIWTRALDLKDESIADKDIELVAEALLRKNQEIGELRVKLQLGNCDKCKPVYCCAGTDCGCHGMPVDFEPTENCDDYCFLKKFERSHKEITQLKDRIKEILGKESEWHSDRFRSWQDYEKEIQSLKDSLRIAEECLKMLGSDAIKWDEIDKKTGGSTVLPWWTREANSALQRIRQK